MVKNKSVFFLVLALAAETTFSSGSTPDQWVLGAAGEKCSKVCSDIGLECNANAQRLTNDEDVTAAFAEVGVDCDDFTPREGYPKIEYRCKNGVPLLHYLDYVKCYGVDPACATTLTCDADHEICTNGQCNHLCRCVNPGASTTTSTEIAPLTCSDNTYASSGAVLAFNPSAAGETFDRSIPTEVDMGPVQWNVLDNGGVTLVSKLKFSASPSNYERVFAATDSATAGNALFQIMRRAETEAMFFIINDGDTSCLSDDIPITNEQWVTMLFQYDAATANIMVQLDGGTKHYKDCSAVAGFSAQNRLQNVNIFGRHGGSSPHFNGAIGGFYGFNSLLTSAQASLVLDSIVVGGDDSSAPLECTPCPTDGTVVAGCSEAACQDIPPTSKFSFEEGLVDETGNAEIQKIAGTGSTFVSDATHGQVLNVHHNLYRIDSATIGAILDANAFSVSFWIRLKEFGSSVDNANLLLSRYDWNVGDNRGGFILWINAKKIALKQYYGPNTTPHEVESTQELSILDNWYHIMLVKVSSTESKIFIDGTLDNSFTFSPAAKSMHNPMDVIGLGAYCYGNTGNADGYSCAVGSSYDDNSKYYMNDLRFYDFAASDTQVAAIANGGDISTCSETTDVPCCSRTWPD